MNIYSPEFITEVNTIIDSHPSKFKPTALIIRKHNKTGLLYLHKTIKLNELHSYHGSGTYWSNHLKKYGKDTEILWYNVFYEKKDIVTFALLLSKLYNVVSSSEWANQTVETGLGGCIKGNGTKTFTAIHKITGERKRLKNDSPEWLSGDYIGNRRGTKFKRENNHSIYKNPKTGETVIVYAHEKHKIKELGLVGINAGKNYKDPNSVYQSEEYKEKVSKALKESWAKRKQAKLNSLQ